MKTRRKKSQMPFADALAAANKRLAKAKKEREETGLRLASLDREIPDLERTIHALTRQLTPEKFAHVSEVAILSESDIDTLQKQYYGPVLKDHPELAAVAELTEDELLPEPEGQPVTPED